VLPCTAKTAHTGGFTARCYRFWHVHKLLTGFQRCDLLIRLCSFDDRECAGISICDDTQYELTAPTTTTDRQCACLHPTRMLAP
jgi:hypothetical protein